MFIYARLVTRAACCLWLHRRAYVEGMGLKFHQKKKEIRLATARHRSGLGHSLVNDKWWQFSSNSEGMLVQARGQRQSAALCSLWGCTTVPWMIHTGVNTHVHKNTSSETSDLCICRAVKLCQNGSSPHPAYNLFYILASSFLFHQLSPAENMTDKSEQSLSARTFL